MAKTKATQRLTSHPVVAKEWRPMIDALRAEGCMFGRGTHGTVIVYKDGNRLPITIGSRSRGSSSRAIANATTSLRRHGLLLNQGKTTAKVEGRNGTRGKQSAPRASVSSGERTSAPTAPTAAEAPVELTAQPVRPHTGHQARLDSIRTRIFRCLRDLGGNNIATRTEFVRFALVEAMKHELRLPRVTEGATEEEALERRYETLMQSLRNFISGRGQSDWVLDIWETAVVALERPRATRLVVVPELEPEPEAEPEPSITHVPIEGGRSGSRGVGVEVEAEPRHAVRLSGGRAAVRLPTGTLDEMIDALPDELREKVIAREALGRQDLVAEVGTMLNDQRRAYIEAMIDRAADGDEDARDRVERILWGIEEG